MAFNEYYILQNDSNPHKAFMKFSSIFASKIFCHEALMIIEYFLKIVPNLKFYFTSLSLVMKKTNTISFPHQKACSYNQIHAEWDEESESSHALNWVQNFRIGMLSYCKGAYSSIAGSEIGNFQDECYGHHLKRLQQIKKKYDPSNFFCFEQSIKN